MQWMTVAFRLEDIYIMMKCLFVCRVFVWPGDDDHDVDWIGRTMAGSTMAEGGFQVGGPSNEQVDATSGEPPGQSGYCDL